MFWYWLRWQEDAQDEPCSYDSYTEFFVLESQYAKH